MTENQNPKPSEVEIFGDSTFCL